MAQPAIQVVGLSLVTRKLKALDVEAPNKVKALNLKAGQTVKGVAEPLVPVESGGLLRTLRAGGTKRSGYVAIGNNGPRRYAGVIHFGWPARNIEPNEFLYHALGTAEPTVVKDYSLGMQSLIREVGL